MVYDIAINKAWEGLAELNTGRNFSVTFFGDEYSVEPAKKQVLSLACNVPAKDFTAILILHYLAQEIKGLPALAGQWLTFRELAGIEGYEPAFRKRAIEPLISKYGSNPQGLFNVTGRLPAKKVEGADAAVILEAFKGVPALIKIWSQDEEFSSDANIYFDASIVKIFCTEDIVVLAGIIAGKL